MANVGPRSALANASEKRRTIQDVVRDISAYSKYETLAGQTSLTAWWREASKWPPDIFALTSVLLEESGAYCAAVSPPDEEKWPPRKTWNSDVEIQASEWQLWAVEKSYPVWLNELVKTINRHLDVPVRRIIEHWDLVCALIELHVAADQACAGVGMNEDPKEPPTDDASLLLLRANTRLGNEHTLSYFSKDLIRLLPKMRTPQRGITLRSMSGHLALCPYGEVDVKYANVRTTIQEHTESFNLLLLPVPLGVSPKNFLPAAGPLANMDDRFRFFKFEPQSIDMSYVEESCREATRRAGDVHGVILPELACSESELKAIQALLVNIFQDDVPFLLAGVRRERANHAEFSVYEKRGKEWRGFAQAKHHRWCLDGAQIGNYNIGSALHASKLWWEDIAIPPRELRFIVGNSWFGMCPLICEDLARQDPVAQIVRALGPPLVVALLLDGPQFESRWPGRYATVLADDPGSSVLTFTALGMAQRSVPRGKTPSRVVGLWKDAKTGTTQLELAPTARSLLLTICNEWTEEFIADGRSDKGHTERGCSASLYLASVEQLR